MTTTPLDADEYFHLALHASSVNDTHACMLYLEEVLLRQPAHARALYLRAVQHAELGLTLRAVSGIRAALEIEPKLEIAHFHLGLLLLFDRAHLAEARKHLLKARTSTHQTLCAYADALVSLADDDSTSARDKLASELARFSNDRPLAALIRQLLERFQ